VGADPYFVPTRRLTAMDTAHTLGFTNFLAQADTLARVLLVILLVMSMITWYLIVTKALAVVIENRKSARFLEMFWDAPSLAAVESHMGAQHPDEPFSRLAKHALAVSHHMDRPGARKLNEAGSTAEFLTRAMRRVIDEETARLESGLTMLASVGSTAPFIGLFGTVWGVYHALIGIGLSGQGTLDKVAGPVGEALIMTALGLAVAIPAVLAYNAFVRSNRVTLARLDAFAHDVYAVLTTGAHVGDPAEAAAVKASPATVAKAGA
jgi:biopolymer transport protein ExbB